MSSRHPLITSPDAWTGPAIQQDRDWTCHLDAADIAEIFIEAFPFDEKQ